MKLLALDTSSIACSAALQLDDDVTERYEVQPREHTRLLVPMIRSLLEDSQLAFDELDAIILGNGPGSFIGMRIAASVAQGLAHGSGLNIIPVSSLAAVAAQVFAESCATEVLVAQDAHMNEVYLGGFRRGERDLPEDLFAERLQAQKAILELNQKSDGSRVAAGAGWHRYPELLEINKARLDLVVDLQHPHAQFLLPLGARDFMAGEWTNPAQLVPAYLRDKVAEKPARPS